MLESTHKIPLTETVIQVKSIGNFYLILVEDDLNDFVVLQINSATKTI